MKIIPSAYICTVVFFQIPSYVEYFKSGNIRPPYGAYLPGIDLNNWTHVILIYLFNASVGLVAFSLTAYESFLTIVFVSVSMFSKIIERELAAFGMALKRGNLSERDVNKSLIRIIAMHLKYNE